jgi:hypothetical protein
VQARRYWSDPVAIAAKWRRITTVTKKLRLTSLSRERALYFKISPRAPRLLPVTESIVLPPRPRGSQYVQIQCSRVARASGTAANLFCAADRRCDAYSVVVPLGGRAPWRAAAAQLRPLRHIRTVRAVL